MDSIDSEMGTALSRINAAQSGLGSLIEGQDVASCRELLIEYQNALSVAKEMMLAVQQRFELLVAEKDKADVAVEAMRANNAEQAKYELTQVAAGVFVYALKAQGPYGGHWLCAKCFDEGKKSVLQVPHRLGHPALECPSCRTLYHLPPKAGGPGRSCR